MFRSFLALFLASALAPALAFAESADSPCNFVDQATIAALKLGRHSMKVVRSEAPGTNVAPPKTLDTCTFTPSANDDSPSISVTAVPVPAGTYALKPSCSETSASDIEFTTCLATVGNTVVSFVLLAKPEHGGPMKAAFPAEIKQLIVRLAERGTRGGPTQ